MPKRFWSANREEGFSLVEAVIATTILSVGLLGLAQVFYVGMRNMATSSSRLIAREKAREAIESVHAARDTSIITWAQIRNVTAPTGCPTGTTGVGGGVFVTPLTSLHASGADGLAGTADDTGDQVAPGPDNKFGTTDDVPLTGLFKRQIQICDVDGNANLRQITVIVEFKVGDQSGTYRLTSYISSYA